MFPRRAFVAAVLSAAVAGGAVGLVSLGAVSGPATDSFRFSRGTAFASGEEARARGLLAQALKDDRTHLAIVGHTGSAGDPAANLALSQDRAEALAAIARDLGVPAAQLSVTGVGGGAPLAQNEGESDRAFQSRLARVDVTLQVRR